MRTFIMGMALLATLSISVPSYAMTDAEFEGVLRVTILQVEKNMEDAVENRDSACPLLKGVAKKSCENMYNLVSLRRFAQRVELEEAIVALTLPAEHRAAVHKLIPSNPTGNETNALWALANKLYPVPKK